MPRAKTVTAGHARRRKVMRMARGASGGRSRLYRVAKENVMRGLQYAYRDRHARKRLMRRLWIQRINAAARMNGLSYSGLMAMLKKAGIAIDRRMLAELAVHDPEVFGRIAAQARATAEQ